jgi:uncharacterized peroxidase-related enzyme
MSLLKTVEPNEAQGRVKKVYDEIQDTFGTIPDGIQLWSVNPKAVEAQWEHIKEVLSMDKDSQKLHTIIRYLMSESNGCEYCIGFNGGMLINMFGMSPQELQTMKEKPNTAPLNEKNKQLLLFALKAVKNAHAITSDDIAKLEDSGLTQTQIFDIVKSAAHMYVVNILFDTFKVVDKR